MAARTRSAQASGGLGVAVGDGLGEEVGDGVGLAEGDAHAEVTTIINRRMATSLPRCVPDEFSMALASIGMDIGCPRLRAARSLLSSTGRLRAPICPACTSASAR